MVAIETLIAGGDDYEILCTVAEDRVDAFMQAAQRAGVALSSIGMLVAGTLAPKFFDGQGGEVALKRRSYSHF
jgi:thiamine-monophosphate kinase